MALYLVRFGYSSETWASLVHNPQDRRELLASRMFAFGGRLHGFWYSLGEPDGFAITEFPDDVSVAAAHIALESSGAFDHMETVQLLTVEEMVEAMERAGDVAYAKPGT